jgi:hypothetical protein
MWTERCVAHWIILMFHSSPFVVGAEVDAGAPSGPINESLSLPSPDSSWTDASRPVPDRHFSGFSVILGREIKRSGASLQNEIPFTTKTREEHDVEHDDL